MKRKRRSQEESVKKNKEDKLKKATEDSNMEATSCESSEDKMVEGEMEVGKKKSSTPVKDHSSGVNIKVPSPAEVLGTPVRKVERRLISAKELASERELQKKRMNKMLNIFPDQREVSSQKAKEADIVSNKEDKEPVPTKKPIGGFPFPIGEKVDGPAPAPSSNGGFAFPLSAVSTISSPPTSSSVAATSSDSAATVKKPETLVTFKLPSESTVTVSSTATVPTPALAKSTPPGSLVAENTKSSSAPTVPSFKRTWRCRFG